MADFDEYEHEGKLVKVPKGTEPTDELLDSLSIEQDKIQKKDAHLAKRQEALDMSEIVFPRAIRALETILSPIAWAGEKFDRIGGAPTRSSIMAMQEGKGISGAVSVFGNQFGAPSAEAPTGKDIAIKAGFDSNPAPRMRLRPDGVWEPGIPATERQQDGVNPDGTIKYTGPDQGTQASPASVMGFGIDVLADPTNLLGVGTGAKMLGKGGMVASSMAARGTAKAVGAGAEIAAKATDVATGTKAATSTLRATKSGIKSLEGAYKTASEALKSRFGTKLAPDFEKSLKIAQDNNIDPDLLPESVTIGPNSSASRMRRHKAEGPLGEPLLESHAKGLRQVQTAVWNDIEKISGPGRPASAGEAGAIIRKAYDDKIESVFSDMDMTYKGFAKKADNIPIPAEAIEKINTKLDDLSEYATDLANNSFDDASEAQGKQILKAIHKVKEGNKDYSSLITGLQGIGRTAFKSKPGGSVIPPDVAKFRQLYHDLSETAVETVRSNFGNEAAEALVKKNAEISKIAGDKEILRVLQEPNSSPDVIFNSLVKNGNQKRIETLKAYLPREDVQKLKGLYLETLIKETTDGEFAFRTFRNALTSKNKRDLMSTLFDPGELDNIKDLANLGDKFGPAVLSTSGTGGSIGFKGLVDKTVNNLSAIPDAIAASRQSAEVKRAVGFDLPGMKQAAKGGENAPIMSLSEKNIKRAFKNPRGKAAQAYYSSEEKKKD